MKITDKLHDILRTLQWLIPAVVALYGTVDAVFNIGAIGIVETLASAVVTFIGVVAQHSSKEYFSTKTVVGKILPDKAPYETEGEVVE